MTVVCTGVLPVEMVKLTSNSVFPLAVDASVILKKWATSPDVPVFAMYDWAEAARTVGDPGVVERALGTVAGTDAIPTELWVHQAMLEAPS